MRLAATQYDLRQRGVALFPSRQHDRGDGSRKQRLDVYLDGGHLKLLRLRL